MKRLLATLAVWGAVALASSSAHASLVTYNLSIDHCSGGGCGLPSGSSYGSITVDTTNTSSELVIVQLASGYQFHGGDNGLISLVFDATGISSVTPSPISSNTGATFTWASGSFHEDGFGTFNNEVDATNVGCTSGNQCGSTMQFTLHGTNIAWQTSSDGDPSVVFAADVTNGRQTGAIGGVVAAVPEPSTWAMMLLGFFGLGFLGYRGRSRRRLRIV